MGKLAEAFVEISAKRDKLAGDLQQSKGMLERFVSSGNGILKGLGASIGLAAIGIAEEGIRRAVLSAGDLNESLSKTETVFGSASDRITGFADAMATQFGSARREILDAASSFGLIFKGAKMSEDASASLSIKLATAADDASSLFNSSLPEALEKIRAGLVGESEPLRAYGVMLSEAAVQQEALAMGLSKTKAEIDEQDKILARASLIQKGLAVAAGDHAKTQGGLNNQLKEFGDRLANFGTSVGQLFIAPLTFALKAVNALLQGMTFLADKLGWLIGAFSRFNGAAAETAKVADKVNAAGAKPGAAKSPAAGAIADNAAAAGEKKKFDARAEVLEDELKDKQAREIKSEREKRAKELADQRKKEMDFRTAEALNIRPFGGGKGNDVATDKEVEAFRRGLSFEAERNKANAFLGNLKDKAGAVLGMAQQLKNDALGVANNIAGKLQEKEKPRTLGGVTDADSYARELQEGALNSVKIQEGILEATKRVPDKLDEVIKVLRGGARDAIARFG